MSHEFDEPTGTQQDELSAALTALRREQIGSAALEDRIVTALRAQGALREAVVTRSPRFSAERVTRLAAAAVVFAAGVLAGRVSAAAAPPQSSNAIDVATHAPLPADTVPAAPVVASTNQGVTAGRLREHTGDFIRFVTPTTVAARGGDSVVPLEIYLQRVGSEYVAVLRRVAAGDSTNPRVRVARQVAVSTMRGAALEFANVEPNSPVAAGLLRAMSLAVRAPSSGGSVIVF